MVAPVWVSVGRETTAVDLEVMMDRFVAPWGARQKNEWPKEVFQRAHAWLLICCRIHGSRDGLLRSSGV